MAPFIIFLPKLLFRKQPAIPNNRHSKLILQELATIGKKCQKESGYKKKKIVTFQILFCIFFF
jgi:hypothetical protein